jgi:hypothetical protein
MGSCFRLVVAFLFFPAILFSQTKKDSVFSYQELTPHLHKYQDDSTFSILFNVSNVFFTAKNQKIDKFLTRYGYNAPQNIPVGINIELAAIPFNSKMMYSLKAGTIVSKQDLITSDFTLGAYRRFFERKQFRIMAGAGLGKHGDRIVLNGNVPPNIDSLAHQYNRVLSFHRTGFLIEPAVRFFWYPVQTKKFQLGLFANAAYDFAFNTRWKLGYYNQNGQFTSFKKIKRPTNVQTEHELGWAFSDGISFCFKFD